MRHLSLVGLLAALQMVSFTTVASAQTPATPRAPSPRAVTSLNSSWRFHQGELAGAERPGTNDLSWSSVTLPHTWNIADARSTHGYYRGASWYRNHLTMPVFAAGERLFLRFGAASLVADVYFNGVLVGHHDGGFTSFTFDVTDQVKPGQEQLLAVRVSNALDQRVAPIDGDFTVFGGLYRGVQLLVTPAVHFSLADAGSDGLYGHVSSLSSHSATVVVSSLVANDGKTASSVQAHVFATNAAGAVVAQTTTAINLAAHGEMTVGTTLTLVNPHLWNGVADPYLYQLHAELLPAATTASPRTALDGVVVPLGVRQLTVTTDRGVLLNGVPLELRGVAMHQDWAGKGWAIATADHQQDIKFLLDMGANAVRLCHYPHAPEELDMLDRAGVLVWSEIPLINLMGTDQNFGAVTKVQLTEMIKQLYNHPAIGFWGLFNELVGDPDGLVAELNALAHSEDPSRVTGAASDQPIDFPLHTIPDVIAFNKYYGWYYGALGDLSAAMAATHSALAQKPLGITEYGAGANITQHQDPPPSDDTPPKFHPEERQNVFHESYLAQLRNEPFLFGHFIWNLFDFAAANRNEGSQPGLNDKGLITYDRSVKKDAYYLYQASWTKTPVLYITSRRFTTRTVANVTVKVYSNQNSVTAYLNGAKLPAPTRHNGSVWAWDQVTLTPGINKISAQSGVLRDDVAWTLRVQ